MHLLERAHDKLPLTGSPPLSLAIPAASPPACASPRPFPILQTHSSEMSCTSLSVHVIGMTISISTCTGSASSKHSAQRNCGRQPPKPSSRSTHNGAYTALD